MVQVYNRKVAKDPVHGRLCDQPVRLLCSKVIKRSQRMSSYHAFKATMGDPAQHLGGTLKSAALGIIPR